MGRTGRIFNIQRFSIHDGPGIRTIVFFKGCYMRCAWCCNPESQEYAIQTMVENGKEKTVGRDVTVDEILPEILADEPYYRRSGGGVTLSGGEFLGQHEFAAELLKACKDYGLHTAVESTANAPFEKIDPPARKLLDKLVYRRVSEVFPPAGIPFSSQLPPPSFLWERSKYYPVPAYGIR